MTSSTIKKIAFVLCFALLSGIVYGVNAKLPQKKVDDNYYIFDVFWNATGCYISQRKDACSAIKNSKDHNYVSAHGLWKTTSCDTKLKPKEVGIKNKELLANIIRIYASNKGLIKHEWNKHGICFFHSADDYFSLILKAYEKYVMDNLGSKLKPYFGGIVTLQNIADALNVPVGSVRLACTASNGKVYLTEIRIALDDSLNPVPLRKPNKDLLQVPTDCPCPNELFLPAKP